MVGADLHLARAHHRHLAVRPAYPVPAAVGQGPTS
jgi:hypothetical protein